MRKFAVALAVLASLTSTAFAEEGPLMVRLRGVNIAPANRSDSGGPLGLERNAISLSSKVVPEVDFTYFVTPNLAAELILTYPQEHNVYLHGEKIGTATELPPCLTAQWHFLPGAQFNPYVGAGVNLTLITERTLGDGTLKLSKSSVGAVGQLGADFKITEHVYFNADIKWVQMGFDVKRISDDLKITKVHVDPWLFGWGVGYRF